MRALALLAVFLLPGLAHAQDAGPLADRVVAALRIDLAVEAGDALADSMEATAQRSRFPGLDRMTGMFRIDGAAAADSIRAALAAGPAPEVLAEALVFLESDASARLQSAMPMLPGMSTFDGLRSLSEGRDTPLADSALAVRLLRATVELTFDPTFQIEMFGLMAEALPPEMGAQMTAEMDGLEAMLASPAAAQMHETQLAMMTPVYRTLLGDLDDAALRAAAAYYESDAGREVTQAVMRGMLRYQAPMLAEMMAPRLNAAPAPPPAPPTPTGNH